MKSSLCVLIFCGCHALLTIQLSNGHGFSVGNITLLQGGSDFRVLDLDVPNPPGVFFGGNGAIIYHSYYTDVESQEDIGVCYDDSGFSCIHGNPLSEDCYNYIRYVSSLGQQCDSSSCPKLYFCGTNALNPACFLCNFTVESGLLNCTFVDNEDDVSDQSCETENPDGGYTFPRTRDENATVLYINDTLQFYFGARESRTNGKSLIGHRIVDPSYGSINPSEVRTRSDSDKAVSDANFVGTPFARGDYVYFLYRETSEEYASLSTGQDNRVGIVYSRIARVCEGDTGYTAGSDTVWSSFLKQRLVCKKAGEDEFSATIYDEIQDFIYDGNETIHAIFTTARYAPPMSALCTFNLTEIDTVFDTGTFYGSDGQTANDLWRENNSPPSPRPGLDCLTPNTADTFFQRDYPNLKPDATEEAEVTRDKDRFSKLALFKESPYTLLIGSESGCLYQYRPETNTSIPPESCEVNETITGLAVPPATANGAYDLYMTTVNGIYGANVVLETETALSPDENLTTHANTVVELIYQGSRDEVSFDLKNETIQILKNEELDDTDPVIMRYQILILENAAVNYGDDRLNITLDNEAITVDEYDERQNEHNQASTANSTLSSTCSQNGPGKFNTSVISEFPVFQYCEDCTYYQDNITRSCDELC